MESKTKTKAVHTLLQKTHDRTIEEWCDFFLRAKEAEGISRYTLINYKQQLTHFIKYCRAQAVEYVSQVDAVFIRDFMTFHASTHNSGGQHMVYRVLRTFLRWYENEVEPDDWKNPIKKTKAHNYAPAYPVSSS